jgi:hypothetical protein
LNPNDFLAELNRRIVVRLPGLNPRVLVQVAGRLLPVFAAGKIR